MKAQLTLTVNEAKQLIAMAVVELPEVKQALQQGRILLKGGTTVSAVAHRLAGIQLRISGLVSPRGTLTSAERSKAPHSVLLQGGKVENIDECFAEVVKTLGPQDLIIISGNALDREGNAAMMAGSVLGGIPGATFSGFFSEGAQLIIPIGLEKLIPGPIGTAVQAAGRKSSSLATGMAVGLIPLLGKVITEKEALEILTEVHCTVIGRGGIMGTEGATVMVIEGERDKVVRSLSLVNELKGSPISGDPESLKECSAATLSCRVHLGCIYKQRKAE